MQWKAVGVYLVLGIAAARCGEGEIPIDALPAVIGSEKPTVIDLSVAMEQRAMEHYQFLAAEITVPEYRQIYRLLAENEKKHLAIVASWKTDMLFKPGMTKEALNQILTYITVATGDSFDGMSSGNSDSATLAQLEKELLFEKEIRELHATEQQNCGPEYKIIYSGMVREETNDIKLLERIIDISREPRHQLTIQETAELDTLTGR